MNITYPNTEIRDFLYEHYDENDLNDLFFDIYGDSIDTLGRDLPRRTLAQEFVVYCRRRDDLPKLLSAMKCTRKEPYLKCFPQFSDPLGLGLSLKPGDKEMQQAEVEGINLPRVQEEGGYMIDEPPKDWIVQELTLRELLLNRLGADLGKDGSANPFVDADRFDQRDILCVRSQTQLRLDWDPGVSLVNGRPTLAFLPEQLPASQLIIMPQERQSVPPSFIRQSLEHIFLTQLSTYLAMANLKSSFASTTRNTSRLRLTAELDQRIDNVSINGSSNHSLTTNQTLIGIQGYTRDYFLILSYISQATSNETEIKNQVALLQSLVDSFKIIKPANMEKQEHRLSAAGDMRYSKYIQLNAGKTILFQYNVLLEQWRGLDWDSPDSSARVISDVKLIQKAIKAFPVQDEEINSLSQGLHQIGLMGPEGIRKLFVSGDKST